jgi:hypothetical protein
MLHRPSSYSIVVCDQFGQELLSSVAWKVVSSHSHRRESHQHCLRVPAGQNCQFLGDSNSDFEPLCDITPHTRWWRVEG